MMSVLEYALDIKRDVNVVLNYCKKLGISAFEENDELSDDDIILLDNEINTDEIEIEEEYEEIGHHVIESSNLKIDESVKKEKLPKKKTFTSNKEIRENKELFQKKKEMYKNKEKLVTNVTNSNVVAYRNDMTIMDLAKELGIEASIIVKKLISLGEMLTVNAVIPFEMAELIVSEYNKELKREETLDESNFEEYEITDDASLLVERPPVVTIMGHVDHGKTTLLDTIRKANVVSGEAGGITQHIGAYQVTIKDKKITFIDTPGHAAFTEMRARGASITDIVIIIVAADDGVMPQTKEAIDHAKAAGVPIIVAINKIDKPNINLDKVYSELSIAGLNPEEWGGDTIFVKVSALSGLGIDDLLENILLVAEMKELKANPQRYATGVVIESKMDKNIGSIATILIQNGTLRLGDPIVVGSYFGKVRSMKNDKLEEITSATLSMPVFVTGITDVASAGDRFMAFETEKQAKQIAEQRKEMLKNKSNTSCALNLDDLFAKIKEGIKEIKVVLKADVKGSEEAVKNSLEKIEVEGTRVVVIRSGTGSINEGDISLANASSAVVIGFNVRPNHEALIKSKECNTDIRLYNIIYKVVEDMESAMKGMLDPIFEEKVTGSAEVRRLFKFSKVGSIAGSYVLDGVIKRDSKARVIRDGIVIYESKISTLQREKDQAKEVKAGLECGITVDSYNDLRERDVIECYEVIQVERK